MIKIIAYQPQHAAIFKALNIAWLDQYNLTESHDLMLLDDPEGTICNQGGVILLVENDGEIVGTGALIPVQDGVYELSKITVAPAMQGRGISKLLLQSLLESAKEKSAKKIILFSNHQLTTALSLYQKFGFKHIEVTGSPFTTADVMMELLLS